MGILRQLFLEDFMGYLEKNMASSQLLYKFGGDYNGRKIEDISHSLKPPKITGLETCVFSVICSTKNKGKNQAEKLRQKAYDYSFVIPGIHWRRKVIWVNFESIIYQFREGLSFTHWKNTRTV